MRAPHTGPSPPVLTMAGFRYLVVARGPPPLHSYTSLPPPSHSWPTLQATWPPTSTPGQHYRPPRPPPSPLANTSSPSFRFCLPPSMTSKPPPQPSHLLLASLTFACFHAPSVLNFHQVPSTFSFHIPSQFICDETIINQQQTGISFSCECAVCRFVEVKYIQKKQQDPLSCVVRIKR